MKRKLITVLSMLVVMLSSVMSGCMSGEISNETSSVEQHSSAQSQNDIPESNNVEVEFTETFKFFEYTIAYGNDWVKKDCSGGTSITKGMDYWIIYATPALFGDEFTVTGLDGIAEKCKNGVCNSVQPLQQFFLSTSTTTQEIDSQEEVTINGIKMLRAAGQINNEDSGLSMDFYGYYLTTEVGDSLYPLYIIGIPVEGDMLTLQNYMDEAMEHITVAE